MGAYFGGLFIAVVLAFGLHAIANAVRKLAAAFDRFTDALERNNRRN